MRRKEIIVRGLEIKLMRIKRGIGQNKLARLVGVSTNWICQIEREKRLPSDELLEKIKAALEAESEGIRARKAG